MTARSDGPRAKHEAALARCRERALGNRANQLDALLDRAGTALLDFAERAW